MADGPSREAPHLPRPAPIEAYGNGGFRFGGMSHRGSLLCFPDGIWAWPITAVDQLDGKALQPVLERAGTLDVFLLGAGENPWAMPEQVRALFRNAGLSVDAMQTGPAVRTYNILMAENRRAGAGLIAVA